MDIAAGSAFRCGSKTPLTDAGHWRMFLFCSVRGKNLPIDWSSAIERHRSALLPIVAHLFALLGLGEGKEVAGRIPAGLRLTILRLLQPAESAVRRLIVLAAQGLAVKPSPRRVLPQAPITGRRGRRHRSFPLFDPRQRLATRPWGAGSGVQPRITVFTPDPRITALWGETPPTPPPASPPDDGLRDAAPLGLRLQALKTALDDLPRQARRLLRWQARRATAQLQRPTFASVLRPGLPPGYRRTPTHDVDNILIGCHHLAKDAIRYDSS
jgi:hypothetical protein